MRALSAVLALPLVLVAGCPSSTDPAEPDAAGDAASTPPMLSLFPLGHSVPPGALADSLVRAGGAVAGTWTLELDGLPATVTGRFEPAALDGAHPGAMLMLDVAADAAAWSGFVTVRARSGARTSEAMFDLTVRAAEGAPDFALYARAPITILPDGNSTIVVPPSGVVDAQIRVVSLAGFAGTVHLDTVGPLQPAPVEPAAVTVGPGVAADATVHLVRGIEDGVSAGGITGAHRMERRVASALTTSAPPDVSSPAVLFGMVDHTWLAPGASAALSGRLLVRSIAEAPTLAVERADVVGASARRQAPDGAWLDLTAGAGIAPGSYRVDLHAAAGAHDARTYTRVVVPATTLPALPGSTVLRAPLASGSALGFVVDGSGTELRFRDGAGWAHAGSADGFTAIAGEGNTDRQVYSGVLGGRVLIDLAGGMAYVTEQRADVGTRNWLAIAGVLAQPAVAYDASNELWVAARTTPGLVTVWRRAANGLITAYSTGLPTTTIDAGPWLAAGAGPPVLAFVHGGTLQVMRWSGSAWSAVPAPVAGAVAGALELDLVLDASGRPVMAVRDGDGGLAVHRLEGGAWVDLALPVDGARVALDPVLALDPGGRIVVAWTEAAHAHLRPTLGPSGARALLTVLEAGTWRAPAAFGLDAGAVPRSLALALAPGGPYLAWAESGEIVVARVPL